MNDRSRTDPKYPHDITYAKAVERQVHDSLFDLWQASGIVVLQQKDAPGTIRIVHRERWVPLACLPYLTT